MTIRTKVNGTWQHVALGVVASAISLLYDGTYWPGLGIMATVELTQADSFGWRHLFKIDTGHDVLMDLAGLLVLHYVIKIVSAWL